MKAKEFQGFSSEMTDFLWELRFNNYKEWFHENKQRYYSLLKDPLHSFGETMCITLKEQLEIEFIASVSRINRDVRFSKNKEPYRDHMWVVFKQDTGTWKDKPCIFFELGADYYMTGMGLYETTPKHMQLFRDMIDSNIPAFERLILPYRNREEFQLMGDCYKKIPPGDKTEEILHWYRRKNLAIIKRQNLNEIFYQRELIEACCEDYKFMMPMLQFFEKIKIS